MNVEIFAVCDAANDSQGKLNLLGTFDSIWAAQIPAVHPQFTVAIRLRVNRAEQGNHKVKLQLVGEQGAPAAATEGDFQVYASDQDPSAAVNLIIAFQHLKFEAWGIYTLTLAVDDRQRAAIPLFIRPMPKPGQTVD